MSKYIENKREYLRLQQKGGNDLCIEQGCNCQNSRDCTCNSQSTVVEHIHKSVIHYLDGLLVELALLDILERLYEPVVKQIACGGEHSLALLNDGTVMSWGNNLLRIPMNNVPDKIQKHVVKIAASWYYSVALLDNNSICIWNHDQIYIINDFRNRVIQITCGSLNLLVLLDDGTVREWSILSQKEPKELNVPSDLYNTKWDIKKELKKRLGTILNEGKLLDKLEELYTEPRIIQIACEHNSSMGLLSDGTVKLWNHVTESKMARPTSNMKYAVKNRMIPNFMPGDVRQIASGNNHSIALLEDGSITGWGSDYDKQVSTVLEFRKKNIKNIKQIACGGYVFNGVIK